MWVHLWQLDLEQHNEMHVGVCCPCWNMRGKQEVTCTQLMQENKQLWLKCPGKTEMGFPYGCSICWVSPELVSSSPTQKAAVVVLSCLVITNEHLITTSATDQLLAGVLP